MSHVNFLNLTNGIEALPLLGDEPYHFVRIQSTACEQKRWAPILEDLDYTFLIALATGRECRIYDYSNKKEVPRALYQGVPWIHFALEKLWYDRTVTAWVKSNNVTAYFEECYVKQRIREIRKLRWMEKFLSGDPIRLVPMPGQTRLDGHYETYREMLLKGTPRVG